MSRCQSNHCIYILVPSGDLPGLQGRSVYLVVQASHMRRAAPTVAIQRARALEWNLTWSLECQGSLRQAGHVTLVAGT